LVRNRHEPHDAEDDINVTVTIEYTPKGSAVISGDGKYRYHLRRTIAPHGRIATFIMLNPSTADAWVDDPTIRKCVGFCQRWDCGELHVVNLFAVRAADPAVMRQSDDPVGPDNCAWVQRIVDITVNRVSPERRGYVVCAWGTRGIYMGQDQNVLGLIAKQCKPMCLGVTQDGHPKHPLYVPYGSANRLRRYLVPKIRNIRGDRPSVSAIRKALPQPTAR
jgi:hypothetical protein